MPCVDNRKRADSIDKFFRILQSSPLFELYLVNLENPVYDESSRLGGLQFLRRFFLHAFLIRRRRFFISLREAIDKHLLQEANDVSH